MAALDAALIAAATAAASLSTQIVLGSALTSTTTLAPLGLRVESVNLLSIASLTGSLSTVSRFSATILNAATLTAMLKPGVAALAATLTGASTLTVTPNFRIALAANLQTIATLSPGFSLGAAALAAALVTTCSVGIDFVAIFTIDELVTSLISTCHQRQRTPLSGASTTWEGSSGRATPGACGSASPSRLRQAAR